MPPIPPLVKARSRRVSVTSCAERVQHVSLGMLTFYKVVTGNQRGVNDLALVIDVPQVNASFGRNGDVGVHDCLSVTAFWLMLFTVETVDQLAGSAVPRFGAWAHLCRVSDSL
jgi:hypothetical protein